MRTESVSTMLYYIAIIKVTYKYFLEWFFPIMIIFTQPLTKYIPMYNYILNSICPKSMFVFFMAGCRKTTAFTYRGQRALAPKKFSQKLGFRPKDFFKPK